MRNWWFISAAVLLTFTTILHVVGGQIDLVDPLMETELLLQKRAELLGVWHMVTVLLLFAAVYIIRTVATNNPSNSVSLRLLAYLFIGLGLPSIIVSLHFMILVPQWVLLMPIGILLLLGIKRDSYHEENSSYRRSS